MNKTVFPLIALTLNMLGSLNIFADDILTIFSYFYLKIGFGISLKLSTA